jgi:phenylpropionate dioxygenase-like ring-hydroxylating dioxygenase large terminal subunit
MPNILDVIGPTCRAATPAEAMTLPPEAYGSDELFGLETERVLRAGWIPLCRVEQVEAAGSYLSVDLLGEPLVVTRDRDLGLHVLSRTCRHRWAEVATGSGVARALQCPYHLWTYGMDGHLAGAPEMQGVEGFCKEDIRLTAYRHEVWQGFVMVNLDGKAESVGTQLAGLDEFVAPYGLAEYKTVEATDWGICDWDWKIMVDNFMECYHHMGPHGPTLQDRFPANLSYTDKGGDHFTTMWTRQADGYPIEPPFLAPGAADLPAANRTKQLIFIAYPLLQVVLTPSFMYWLQALPVSPGHIELKLDIAMSPAAMAAPDADDLRQQIVAGVISIHREDLDICNAVQRAVRGGAKGTGRLSLLEQPLWEFYRYLGRRLGVIDSVYHAPDTAVPFDATTPVVAGV